MGAGFAGVTRFGTFYESIIFERFSLGMDTTDILISIALDLTAALNAEDRYQRLLESLQRAIPYDAAALLRIEGDALTVMASKGLVEDIRERRFMRSEHPRLDIICSSKTPVRFPTDSHFPDPYDGFLADAALSDSRIHSCLGCPLFADDTLIGALTADAVDPLAFEMLDLRFIRAVGALAGAEMHTTDLMKALEVSAEKMGLITQDLMRAVHQGRGDGMIGTSRVMQHLRREIDLVAPSDFSILVTGETGVGKELVAGAIHAASRRSNSPILYVNCASLPETLAESELFGHVRGAFTGAVSDRTGKFELADAGTLFLDEVGELPLSVQPKLLRVLQEGEVEKIGSGKIRKTNVRLIAATNRSLENEVKAGRFRADLFHRLNVYPIRVAPLREHIQDIPLLCGYFCEQTQRQLGIGTVRLGPDVLSALKRYAWPGNVRELRNVLTRAILKSAADVVPGNQVTVIPNHLGIDFEAVPSAARISVPAINSAVPENQGLRSAVDAFQKKVIMDAVRMNNGNWAATARQLGLHRSNLHKLAVRLKIK